jgi:hypothetical protein
MSKAPLRILQLVIIAGFLCAGGCVETSQGQTRVTRYGVTFSLPQVKHLVLLNGLKRWVMGYITPYDISYNWDRPNQWMASFRLDFIPITEVGNKLPLNKDTVKVFLSGWGSQKHFELIELAVDNDDRFHQGSYKFRLGRKFTNIGNAGQAIQLEGYLLVHPFDPNYLVILSVVRGYDLQPETPDRELHDIGVDWLASVTFSDPTLQERERMRPPKGKWQWIKP